MPPTPMFVTTTRATAVPLLATETVIFQIRRSILFLIVPILFVSIAGVILAFVLNNLSLPLALLGILRMAIIVVIIFVDIIIALDWLTTVYLLTNRRVQFRFGIIGQQTKTIALEQITDTRVLIGILGRIFNYGGVDIDAANINSHMLFGGISSPQARLDQVNSAQLNH